MKRIIGLSGVAGAGKDLFYSLLSKRVKCNRYALADALKEEVSGWCKENYDICPVHCSREEKTKIRPFLVWHGKLRRENSNGRYWIDKLKERMDWWDAWKPIPGKEKALVVVTDIRYNSYEKDEAHWIKDEMGGSLVHISQYKEEEVADKRNWPLTKTGKVFREPANEDETKWDPVLRDLADYRVEWPWVEEEQREENLIKYVDNFLVDFNK